MISFFNGLKTYGKNNQLKNLNVAFIFLSILIGYFLGKLERFMQTNKIIQKLKIVCKVPLVSGAIAFALAIFKTSHTTY